MRSISRMDGGRAQSGEAFEVMRAELAARGGGAVFERIKGGSHAVDGPGEETAAGFLGVFGRMFRRFGLEGQGVLIFGERNCLSTTKESGCPVDLLSKTICKPADAGR